ncbi:MAG: DNA-methyltransferase [Promethearchaeota archaeon]
MVYKIILGDCETELDNFHTIDFFKELHLSFLDPPFNQSKNYTKHNDAMPEEKYWDWMTRICQKIYTLTAPGGAIYFMQREKNTESVLKTLRTTGWTFQNLIIWKKLTSAVPGKYRYGKQYQIIAFATKGARPRIFNRLRIDLLPDPHHKIPRENGVYITDIWADIRELTSGYFAGDEAIRIQNNKLFTKKGDRFHKQQAPIRLLTQIILTSSKPHDLVLDPFAGTGVTNVVAEQLVRKSIAIELDPKNADLISQRLKMKRPADDISKFYNYYRYTDNLKSIWPTTHVPSSTKVAKSLKDYF